MSQIAFAALRLMELVGVATLLTFITYPIARFVTKTGPRP